MYPAQTSPLTCLVPNWGMFSDALRRWAHRRRVRRRRRRSLEVWVPRRSSRSVARPRKKLKLDELEYLRRNNYRRPESNYCEEEGKKKISVHRDIVVMALITTVTSAARKNFILESNHSCALIFHGALFTEFTQTQQIINSYHSLWKSRKWLITDFFYHYFLRGDRFFRRRKGTATTMIWTRSREHARRLYKFEWKLILFSKITDVRTGSHLWTSSFSNEEQDTSRRKT